MNHDIPVPTCMQIFCSTLLHSNGNVADALQRTFMELDAKLKAGSPAITKVSQFSYHYTIETCHE